MKPVTSVMKTDLREVRASAALMKVKLRSRQLFLMTFMLSQGVIDAGVMLGVTLLNE